MRLLLSLLLALLIANPISAQQTTISEKTDGLSKSEGYFNFWYDEAKDKLWLEVDQLNTEFLYVNSLTAGVGSNDIGLDRGQLGDSRVVYFERRGPKLLLIEPNYNFRAETDNPLEKKSVEEAFASSVLWGFEIEAEENGKLLINLNPFLLRDAHGVTRSLQRTNQGAYKLDLSRSALYSEAILNFPKNSEFEAILTFQGENPGNFVRSVVPTPEAITIRQHHSFIELPDYNFEKRKFDPRAGYFGISYQDYGTPIQKNLTKRFIARHRLQKKNPEAFVSEPVEPIIYYLDNGTPEPVRSALLDGARWWNQAFEAAGYKDAFIVKILPEDAHPLDVRYNVIQWIHRSTRGWSYGSSVTDPRTGEIIKGHVSLGSLRVRQDFLIAEGLLAPYSDESSENPAMEEMALARIRQLSAHEVGHTLGIMHNFAASTNNDASVMDYPHPQAVLKNGEIDLSSAYSVGIGEWDIMAVKYGYQDFPDEADENTELNKILEEAYDSGLKFISDQDARPQGGAHPDAHLWEYGNEVSEQLQHILEVRQTALDHFGEANIKQGEPLAKLQEVLVPIYFYHRYQTEATVKLIGGLDYNYKLKGDNQPLPQIVEKQVQEKALADILQTINLEVLAIPENLLELIPPRPAGMGYSRELFNGNTGPALDALAIAESAADMSVSLLLNPARANRLVEYSVREDNLSLEEVIEELFNASWNKEVRNGYTGSVQRVVNVVVLKNILTLLASEDANPVTKSVVHKKLQELNEQLNSRNHIDRHYARHLIDSYLKNPEDFKTPEAPALPPGSPIGSGERWDCRM